MHVLHGHTGYVLTVAWHSDSAMVASGSADRFVRLWDARDLWDAREGTAIQTLGGHTSWVHGVAWAPDGMCLAPCGGQEGGRLRIWAPR